MYSRSSVYLIIIVAFLLSAILSTHYVSKYDHIKTSGEGYREHAMIKIAIVNHWQDANKILEDIRSGKNYFVAGKEYYDEFLPQKLLALYYYVANYEIFDSNMEFNTNNGKLPYLIIKTFLYYLALFYLCKKLFNIFPIKNCFFIILFLAIEPSIFQYHSSFWNESLFFPFQILLLALLLVQSKNISNNIFVGFILGIMFTISQEIFFYIIPLLFYFIIFFKKKSLKPIFGVITGYMLVFIIIGFHNYKRIGETNFLPNGSKTALYTYLAPQILAKKNNSSDSQAREMIKEETKMWIEKNNVDVILSETGSYEIVGGSTRDKDRYYGYLQKKSLEIIFGNPVISIGHIFQQSLHMMVLNPVYIKYFYQFDSRGKNKYYKSETHKKWIPARVIYSLIIYFVIFCGIIYSPKYMNGGIIFLLIISVAYVMVTLGWMGISRYFTPGLIFLSFFFGNGMTAILNFKKSNILK